MKRKKIRYNNPEQSAPEHLPEVINFNYDGNPVSFTVNGKVMVNATEIRATAPKYRICIKKTIFVYHNKN